ncbi:MAG: hypothetical protein JWN63_2373 [Candidatus Acidoferrum typicum]|jgi:hypothetical protein|nr:hypothetical protein [Candidatus Acidoferrum typicum]
MRKLTLILPFLAAWLLTAEQGASQQPSSLKTTSLESHEGMTITARPWTDPALYKEKFPKKSPFAAGIIAVQVVFRNDSDDSMKINLERIRLNLTLSEEDHQALYPLSPEEAADVITHPSAKNVTGKRLPIPLGGPKTGRDKKWTEVEQSVRDAGVQASVLAPHSTVQGLLYFDLRSQFELLNTAHLYVPEIVAIEKNRGLMYFEIDLRRSAER